MILIALGSNLPGLYGSPEKTLKQAMCAFDLHGIHIVRASRIWLTAPVPVSDQPWFRNAVVSVSTDLPLTALHDTLQIIEKEFGRVRGCCNAPRILDLDLIAYHQEICETDHLIVPHPRMCERMFVLAPLFEIAPGWIHPVLNISVEDLIEKIPPGQFVRTLEHEAV